MSKIKWLLLLVFLSVNNIVSSQALPGDSLVFGPMFSPVYGDSVRVWVLTKNNTGFNSNLSIEMKSISTGIQLTGSSYDIDTRLGYNLRSYLYTGLQLGSTYKAEIFSNGISIGKKALITNEQNQISDFEFLSGGCARIYDPTRCVDQQEMPTHINGTPEIFNHMATEGSDLMVWLGDATYLLGLEHASGNCPGMINDWDTDDALFKRYYFYRQFHDSLLKAMPQIGITDNHDTGGNEFGMTMPTLPLSRSTFMKWWPNPSYLSTSYSQGMFSKYKYKDVEFFLTDNRSYRTDQTQQFGSEQLEWLKQSLLNSTAPFKILIIGTPFVDKTFMRAFAKTAECDSLISFIKQHNIDGVMCYSADWHYVELFGDYDKHTYPFFDILDGKLNSDAGGNIDPTVYFTPNSQKIYGYNKQIYIRTNVYGQGGDRRYKIEYVDPTGVTKFGSIIHEDMLKSIDNDTRKLSLSFSSSIADSSDYNHIVQTSNINYNLDNESNAISSLELNNTSSVTISHSNEFDMNDRAFSITYWLNPAVFPSSFSSVFSNGTNGLGISVGIDSLGHPVYINHNNGAKYTGSFIQAIGTWSHIIWKYDNVRLILFLYKNGVLVQQWNNVICPSVSTAQLIIGSNFQSSHYNGLLDEFNLFGKLISKQTIQILSNYKPTRGASVMLNGSQNINIPTTQINNAFDNGFTIECWAKITAYTPNNKILASNANISNSTKGISLQFNNSNQLNIAIGSGTSSWKTISTTYVPVLNEWNHYAISAVNNDSVYFYVNGIKMGKVAYADYVPTTYGMYFGKSLYYGGPIVGEMDDIRIWNLPQSQQNIQKRMHYQLDGNETNLAYYYNFDYTMDSLAYLCKGSGNYNMPIAGTSLNESTAPVVIIDFIYRDKVSGNWSVSMNENNGLSFPVSISDYYSNIIVGKNLNQTIEETVINNHIYNYISGGWYLSSQNIPMASVRVFLDSISNQFDSIKTIATEYYLFKKNDQGLLDIKNSSSISNTQLNFLNTILDSGVYYLGWKSDSTIENVLVPENGVWKYSDIGAFPGASWTNLSFDDSNWSEGRAELGYGDGDENTIVSFGPNSTSKYSTTYFRKTFQINSSVLNSSGTFQLKVKRDDGIVVYINGNEIYRNNMPSGSVSYTTYSSTTCSDDGAIWIIYDIPSLNLYLGSNVVTAEIHQANASSSDISFDLTLLQIKSLNDMSTLVMECGNNITVLSSQNNTMPDVTTNITASTTCPQNGVLVSQSPSIGSVLNLGNNPVNITAIDSCNNLDTCTIIVQYIDDAGLFNLFDAISFKAYPNPAHGIINVEYFIPTSSKIQLNLIDARGKLIANLINENSPFNKVKYTFELNSYNQGMYLFELIVDENKQYKKLILE